MSIEILNYKDIPNNPSVIGEFDLYKLKAIRTKKGALFIAIPTWCEKFDDGTKKFHPYITFSKQKGESFQKAVVDKLKECGFVQ